VRPKNIWKTDLEKNVVLSTAGKRHRQQHKTELDGVKLSVVFTPVVPGFSNSSYPENLELFLEQETTAF